jgi:hypothetical protein
LENKQLLPCSQRFQNAAQEDITAVVYYEIDKVAQKQFNLSMTSSLEMKVLMAH